VKIGYGIVYSLWEGIIVIVVQCNVVVQIILSDRIRTGEVITNYPHGVSAHYESKC